MTIIKQKDDQTNPKLYISPCGRVIKQNFQVPIQLQQHFYKRRFEVLNFEVGPRHLCQLCTQCCLLPSDCSPKKVVVTSIHWSSFLLIWANSYYSIPAPELRLFWWGFPYTKKTFWGWPTGGKWSLEFAQGRWFRKFANQIQRLGLISCFTNIIFDGQLAGVHHCGV